MTITPATARARGVGSTTEWAAVAAVIGSSPR